MGERQADKLSVLPWSSQPNWCSSRASLRTTSIALKNALAEQFGETKLPHFRKTTATEETTPEGKKDAPDHQHRWKELVFKTTVNFFLVVQFAVNNRRGHEPHREHSLHLNAAVQNE